MHNFTACEKHSLQFALVQPFSGECERESPWRGGYGDLIFCAVDPDNPDQSERAMLDKEYQRRLIDPQYAPCSDCGFHKSVHSDSWPSASKQRHPFRLPPRDTKRENQPT